MKKDLKTQKNLDQYNYSGNFPEEERKTFLTENTHNEYKITKDSGRKIIKIFGREISLKTLLMFGAIGVVLIIYLIFLFSEIV
jgi:hypothetical protein